MATGDPVTVGVLGAGGFIGSHLVEALLDRGRRVIAADRDRRKIAHLAGRPGLDFREVDLGDPARAAALAGEAGVVVHLAALCNPSLYNTRPLEVIESNYHQALPVVRACRERGTRLVHFSTCEVYGRTLAGFAPEGSPLREDPGLVLLREESSPLVLGPLHRQRWTYAAAKGLLERVIHAEGTEHGLRWTIVRPFNWIGPRMDFIPGVDGEGLPRVLACFLEALLKGRPLPLVDGGRARRTFLHVEDGVDAVLRILDRPEAAGGRVFNVGHPGNETTIAGLADLVVAAWEEARGERWPHGVRAVPAEEFYGPGYDDSDRRVPDVSLARDLLGWEPRVPLEEAVRRVVPEALREYGARMA